MRTQPYFISFCLVAALSTLAPTAANAEGPDLTIGGIGESNSHGNVAPLTYSSSGSPDIAYIFNFLTCNVGNQVASFQTTPPLHPVTGQSLFRLSNGRFEQIGVSWIHHNYCALQNNFCDTCTPNQNCAFLGVGCTTVNSAGNAGSQLAPRSQINAAAATFTFPSPIISGGIPTVLDGRIRVHQSDVQPSLNPDATYFAEASLSAADDMNPYNDASYREVVFQPSLAVTYPTPVGSTTAGVPAIYAWPQADPEVQISQVALPNESGTGRDGLFVVAAKVRELPEAQWAYEYAVYNLNSDCACGSWTIPVLTGVTITDIGFHDVEYSGPEPIDGTDWPAIVDSGQITWSTESFADNPNANAIRWGTLYNFRFIANTPPTEGQATLGLFKDCGFDDPEVTVPVPSSPAICACPGDADADGAIDGKDIAAFVDMYLGQSPVSVCAKLTAPGGGDLNDADVAAFVDIVLSDAGCP